MSYLPSWLLLTVVVMGPFVYLLMVRLGVSLWPAYLVGINAASLAVYVLDKAQGERQEKLKAAGNPESERVSRAPNELLFLLAVVGGSVGAVIGIVLGTHKTSKDYDFFRLLILLVLLGQLFIVYCRVFAADGQCEQICGFVGAWLSGSPGD